MANNWNVMFKLDWCLNDYEVQEVEKKIPRSTARIGEDDTTVIGVRQGAPTSGDAINRVGGQLRSVLGRSRLGVIDVKVRPVSDDQKLEDKIDDLMRRFKGD